MTREATLLALPANDAARRERRLRAKWSEIDRIEAQLKALRAAVAPLQGEVSRDYGYPFNVSRDALPLAMKARK
jgi:hypothetical protein